MDATGILFFLALGGGFLWEVTADTLENPFEMDDYLWEHQVKKTFCSLIQQHRIYREENLDVYCAAKVKFFHYQVK